MNQIFNEIEDDLKQDKFINFLKKYKFIIIIFIIIFFSYSCKIIIVIIKSEIRASREFLDRTNSKSLNRTRERAACEGDWADPHIVCSSIEIKANLW